MENRLFVAIIIIVVGVVSLWYFMGPASQNGQLSNVSVSGTLPTPGANRSNEIEKEITLRNVNALMQANRENPVNVDAAFRDVDALLRDFTF